MIDVLYICKDSMVMYRLEYVIIVVNLNNYYCCKLYHPKKLVSVNINLKNYYLRIV